MQLPILEPIDTMRVDALLVLGRGIESDGTLSEMSRLRAEVGARMATILMPRVVVFSGGRSWRQARRGVLPPSEGGAMLAHGMAALKERPVDIGLHAEEDSESTVANMVNSHPLLAMRRGETLGLVSDKLHFLYQRPQRIARKVFGRGITIQTLTIPSPMTPAEIREERMTSYATTIALAGVRRGNLPGITRRQHGLERVNAMLHR